MALTNGAPPGHLPHVPAWKRLGLKLKYAKDTAEPSSNPQQPNHSNPNLAEKKQSIKADTSADNERPSKKRKTSSESHRANQSESESQLQARGSPLRTPSSRSRGYPPVEQQSEVRVSVEAEPARETGGSSASESQRRSKKQPTTTIKRRKSVTFTEETKADDGNSAESVPAPASDSTTSTAALSPSKVSNSVEQPIKKSKKSKKESSRHTDLSTLSSEKDKISIKNSQPTEPPEYRRYLEQFHQDKASWKFNKNHQTALLKNLFDIRAIPASLTPAVASYIAGLQGAGPRERLIETATSILETFAEKDGTLDDIREMNTESARREAYYKAMSREIKKWEDAGMPRSEYDDDQIANMDAEIEKGRRAEEVLRALPMSQSQTGPAASTIQASSTDTSQESNTEASPLKATSARKRKKRVDVDTDSSSSDSDSSSSDDEGVTTIKQPARKEPKTVSASLRPTPGFEPKPKVPSPPRSYAYQHDNLNVAYRPQNPSQLMNATVKPTKKFFDDDLLDAAFPKKKTYNDVAPKRRKVDGSGKKGKDQARGFAYTHGTRVDESGSEEDE